MCLIYKLKEWIVPIPKAASEEGITVAKIDQDPRTVNVREHWF